MKLVKKLVLAAVVVLTGVAQADALYWQVDTQAADAFYKGDDVAFAAVYATSTSESYSYANREYVSSITMDSGTKGAPQMADLGSYGSSSYSFFVELYNASGEVLHTGYANTYNQLLGSGYISTSKDAFAPTVLASGGYNGASVPEPTSGMLLLMGGALLALRRRRQ